MAGHNSGKREGAGRPKGSRNNRALADIEAMAKRFPDWTPLQHMAAVANDESLDVEIRLDAAKAAAPYVHARAKPVEIDPDSLVALEGRIHRARLEAVAELARDDPALVTLADRLARAKDRQAHFVIVAPRSSAPPLIDATPTPAPEPEPASSSDISAEGDGAEGATPPPPPPPAPPPAPILPWPDAPATAEQDYDPWNFD